MPKKPNASLRLKEEYVATYIINGEYKVQNYVGFKVAVDGYRWLRKLYGNNVRLSQVLFNYGEEI